MPESKTWREVFETYKPEITDDEISSFLWNFTCYPFDDLTTLKQIELHFKSNLQDEHKH